MDVSSVVEAAALVGVAFVTATAALVCVQVSMGRQGTVTAADRAEVAFLFESGALVDATHAGRRLLRFASARGSDMTRLVAFLSPRFPDLQARIQSCGEDDRMLLLSTDNRARLRLESRAGRLRIALEDVEDDPADLPDRHSLLVLGTELENHRVASELSPVPVWRLDKANRVTWANGAYWGLAEKAQLTAGLEPGCFPVLFEETGDMTLPPDTIRRLQLTLPGEQGPRWFDATVNAAGADRIVAAVPADAVVAAERNLREFIQTLTQTFAHLSVGLAIFDRKRELTLFNPALGDLMGFDVEFLVARPSLIRFLDQLRERHMMPEPKDYKTWRQRMSDLEAAAAEGGHSETWPLADGRTFRITGRPHPDGAVAFLFEDISAEITLSREYREELETGQAVIDTMEEAIAVFSADGRLSFANRAYARIWGLRDGAGGNPVTFLESSRLWQQACQPSPVWGDARDFAHEMSGRTTWHAEVRLHDGSRLGCRFEPLPGGATMAGFAELDQDRLPAKAADLAEPLSPIRASARA